MTRTIEELDTIINENIGTRGDCLPEDLTPDDWAYIYEAIDTCDMCGHWEDAPSRAERGYCERCQSDYPEDEDD